MARKRKRKDEHTLGWLLLTGSAALAIYLLLKPKETPVQTMVPTVDPRFAGPSAVPGWSGALRRFGRG